MPDSCSDGLLPADLMALLFVSHTIVSSEAALDGVWIADNDGDRSTISSGVLMWSHGKQSALTDRTARGFTTVLGEETYNVILKSDGCLHWIDGDVWRRQDGKKTVEFFRPEAIPSSCAILKEALDDVPFERSPILQTSFGTLLDRSWPIRSSLDSVAGYRTVPTRFPGILNTWLLSPSGSEDKA